MSATAVVDDPRAGAHCAVRGAVNERTGSDGSVVPAYGGLGGNQPDNALTRGYAVLSSDSGHDGQANADAGSSTATCSASITKRASTMATPRTSR